MLSLALQERHPQLLRSSVTLRSVGADKGRAFLKVRASLAAMPWVVHPGLFPAGDLLTPEGAVQLQGLQGSTQPYLSAFLRVRVFLGQLPSLMSNNIIMYRFLKLQKWKPQGE